MIFKREEYEFEYRIDKVDPFSSSS